MKVSAALSPKSASMTPSKGSLFCNAAFPFVCEQLKEDEPRLIRTPNSNIIMSL